MNQLLAKMIVAGAVIVSLTGCGQEAPKPPEVKVQKEALPAQEAAPAETAPAAPAAPAMQKSEATEPAAQEVASQDAPAEATSQE